jgi:altronate hydrolase
MKVGAIKDFTGIALLLHPADSAAIAKMDIPAGTRITLQHPGKPHREITVQQDVPAGHKFATHEIEEGKDVLRYGQKIGLATQDIHRGDWVHTHNLSTGDMDREFSIQVVPPPPPIQKEAGELTFMGYPRPGGLVGTRNLIAVVSSVSCSAQVVRAIAGAFPRDTLRDFPQVDGVIAITHATGCCVPLGSTSLAYLQRTLSQIARHPNVGGVVYVSLGCEGNQMQALVQPNWDRLDSLERATCVVGPYLVIQECGGIAGTVRAGTEAVRQMLPFVNANQRKPAPLSGLTVALQCGGSDGWSGVTANPLVGRVSDRIVQAGGTVVLAETPEIYGAEHLLLNRVVSEAAGHKLVAIIQEWQRQSQVYGFSMDNNPSPGNKKGGLTTIFEKSLGAVAKAGSTPLVDALGYAEWITSKGLVFMDSPGYDPVSVTGQVAGGCNLVIFTTGRGSVFGGSLAPCLKVVSNSDTYRRMAADMDYNAGVLLEGMSLDTAAEELLAMLVGAASGMQTKSEAAAFREEEFIPWQLHATL